MNFTFQEGINMQLKPIISACEAATKIKDGATVMIGGFMTVGTPEVLIDTISKTDITDLTIICNDTGLPNKGIGVLIRNKQANKVIASHIGLNPETGIQMNDGSIDVVLVPQGTLVEQIRCGGAGLGGVLTQTGIDTLVAEGKDIIIRNGNSYLLEDPLYADVALIKASIVDRSGNCIFKKTTKNFNPVMATAAKIVIVQADQIVDVGVVEADQFMLPGTFIDYIVTE